MKGKIFLGSAVLLGMTACSNKAEKSMEDSDSVVVMEVAEEVVADSVTEQPDTAMAPEVEAAPVDAKEEVKKEEAKKEEPKAKGDGYTTTASGLKYKVLKKGNGKKPKATDVVLVNYEGKLLDGTVFDSSYQRGEPISFPLNRVIPGWTEGVQLMNEGSTYEFYIPYNLAYGERGAGPIPPKSDLIFKVELIEVK